MDRDDIAANIGSATSPNPRIGWPNAVTLIASTRETVRASERDIAGRENATETAPSAESAGWSEHGGHRNWRLLEFRLF